MSRAAPLLPATTVEDAVALVHRHARAMPPLAAEQIELGRAVGRVLAEPVLARWPLPEADLSIMDGWAVRAADLSAGAPGPVELRASGHTAAGHPSDLPLEPGTAGRIFTGAVLPSGADAVVAQEDVEVFADGTGVRVDQGAVVSTQPGRFVRARASEVAEGAVVAEAGIRIDSGSLAGLASVGHATVRVRRRPRVAIISTGDELVPLGQRPGPGKIVSSNGLMLAAQVREAGGEPWVLPDAVDDPARLRATLQQGLTADIVVTSGGISVGDHDHVRPQLEALGVEIHMHGLALRPGKPAAFGTFGDTLVFGLPGNPASTWVTFMLLVAPALQLRAGAAAPRPALRVPVTTAGRLRGAGPRAHYVRARWVEGETLTAEPLSAQQSGNLRSIGRVDLLLVVPIGTEAIEAGEVCDALVLRAPPTAVDAGR